MSESRILVILDNTVLTNFARVRCADLLFALWSGMVCTTPAAIAEYDVASAKGILPADIWRALNILVLSEDEMKDLTDWLMRYQGYPVLASVSDGEERIIAALRAVWPNAPRQRCQEHFLGNLAEEVLEHDAELRKQMRVDLGGLPKISDLPADSSFF